MSLNRTEPADLSEDERLQCPVCLGPFVGAVETQCGHAYCATCAVRWIESADRTMRERTGSSLVPCAVCRTPIESIHPSFVLRSLTNRSRPSTREETAAIQAAEAALRARFGSSVRGWAGWRRSLLDGWTFLTQGTRGTPPQWFAPLTGFLLALACAYVLLPFDLVPDGAGGLMSLLDDFVVVLWCVVVILAIREWL